MVNSIPRALLLAFACLLVLAACADDAIDTRSGLSAKLRLSNGQFKPGHFPVDVGSDAGPAPIPLADGGAIAPPSVVTYDIVTTTAERGTVGKSFRVIVTPVTRTVAIGLEGDDGYWLVPVASPSLEYAPNLELGANFDLDYSLPLGPAKIWLAAIDKDGVVGAARALEITIVDDLPKAPLVLSLSWNSNADLDLVIVHPDGTVLSNKSQPGPTSPGIAGKFDLDSDANCIADGHRMENAAYTAASAGLYNVYVRQSASCGFPVTGWTVRVLRDGNEISRASGAAYAYETDLPNGGPNGPGRFALSFNVGG